jgi:hypothetical protein
MGNTQTLAQKPTTHSNVASLTNASPSSVGLAPHSTTSAAATTPPTGTTGLNLTPPHHHKSGRAKDERTRGEWVKIAITAYGASLEMTGVIVPFVASVMMVAFYLTLPNALISLPQLGIDPSSKWYAFVASALVTGVLWLISAVLRCPFVTAPSANPHSYGLLRSRLCQLKVNLGIEEVDRELKALEHQHSDLALAVKNIQALKLGALDETSCKCNQAARADALACYIDIRKMLLQTPAGLTWALGTGYIDAWSLLHHAEEALIEFEGVPEVIRGAMHDKLAIQGSAISGKDELLDKLMQAVKVLDPTAGVYFKEHQPNNCTALDELAEAFKKKALQQMLTQNGLGSDEAKKNRSKASTLARIALREVRSTLNSFRDKSWEAIARARNRLLTSIAVTGAVTHILLCIAILSSDVPSDRHPPTALIAATAFYLIGAVTGLFGRFYNESVAGSAVDDFGFSAARLVATPLLSGLAGIGGVLVTVMVAALGGAALGNSMSVSVMLNDIFKLDPRLLLAAAVFGLTPNLLIKGLQEKAKKFESDLLSSKAEASTVTDSAA